MNLSRSRVLVVVALTVAGSAWAGSATGAAYTLDRTLGDPAIAESSGLARSTYGTGVLWTHNDSGDTARIFAVGADGTTLGTYDLTGASDSDYEDIAAGPQHTLWVGDIGDNARSRQRIQVYAMTEPATPTGGSLAATKYQFVYPDGPHNAEGLMVHPTTGRVYVVTKQNSGAAIYAAPQSLSTTSNNALTKVASAPPVVTGAAFSPHGFTYALVDYSQAYVYSGFGATPTVFAKPSLAQGESVEVTADGKRLLMGSEGHSSPVYATAWPIFQPKGGLAVTPGARTTVTSGPSFTDGRKTATFTVPRLTGNGSGLSVAVALRGSGTGTAYEQRLTVDGAGHTTLTVLQAVSGSPDTLLGSVTLPLTLVAGDSVRLEAGVSGAGPVTLQVRAYLYGAPVPAWQLTATDTSGASLLNAAEPRLWASLPADATSPLTVPYGGTATTVVR